MAELGIIHHFIRNCLGLSNKSILHKLKAQGGLPIEKSLSLKLIIQK